MSPSTRDTLHANAHVTLVETAHGGHCAFLAPAAGYDGYWAEKTLLDFMLLGHETLMEADWAVELAADDPEIVVPWGIAGRRPAVPKSNSSICAWMAGFRSTRLKKPGSTRLAIRARVLNAKDSPAFGQRNAMHGPAARRMEPRPSIPTKWLPSPARPPLAPDHTLIFYRARSLFLSSFERQERWIRSVTETLAPSRQARPESNLYCGELRFEAATDLE